MFAKAVSSPIQEAEEEEEPKEPEPKVEPKVEAKGADSLDALLKPKAKATLAPLSNTHFTDEIGKLLAAENMQQKTTLLPRKLDALDPLDSKVEKDDKRNVVFELRFIFPIKPFRSTYYVVCFSLLGFHCFLHVVQ